MSFPGVMILKIDVLGTEYSLEVIPAHSDRLLKPGNIDGYCDSTSKRIMISDCAESDLDNVEIYIKEVKRHEIIHAFLNESGLQSSWEHPATGQEETVVDWIALQFPKLITAFKAADAL